VIRKNQKKLRMDELKYHSLLRDNQSEHLAVKKLIELCRKYGNKIHLTHIGTRESMELIIKAKKEGLKVTCDTCPHYLFLDDSIYERIGNKAKVNPPVRSASDKEALWDYLNEGHIDCICSDHAPHTPEEKNLTYDSCPAGFPGVETTAKLMLTAVSEGKIKLEVFIKLMAENPARIFRIKNKGFIREGYDADITIVDLKKESVILGKNLFTKARWTPFEGFKAKGDVAYTIINGNIIYDGKTHDEKIGKEVNLL
jgi:dihydroorotase (multifunctional complex type)